MDHADGKVEAGELDKVGAVVLPYCNHIPGAQRKIDGVGQGAALVIGDQWPCGWDEGCPAADPR